MNHQWSKGWAFEQAFAAHVRSARRRRPALLLAAAPVERTRGRAPVREDRPLRRVVLQLQPQLPPARRTPGQPLVRRLPEVPFRVPRARAVHVQAAAGRHLRPQPAGRSGAERRLSTRCSNTRTTSRSNASAKAANRARRWQALAARPEWREDALVERFAREIRPQLDASELGVDAAARARRRARHSRIDLGHACVRCLPLRSRSLTPSPATAGASRCGAGAARAAPRIARSGRRLPTLPLTLFCDADEAAQAGTQRRRAASPIEHAKPTGERLSAFDGGGQVAGHQSRTARRPGGRRARHALHRRHRAVVRRTRPDARTLCVTGTKGKSTTTALLAHLLRAGGHRTALAGNIGLPLLELLDARAEFWAIELSSYQTGDVAASGVRPEIAVALNVFPEHLDWHGSQARYVADKLRAADRSEAAHRRPQCRRSDARRARSARQRGALVRSRGRLAPARRRAVSGRRCGHGHVEPAAAGPPQPQQPVRGADRDRCGRAGCRRARAACARRSGRCRIGCSRSARATASPTSTIRSAPRRTPASRRWSCSADRRVAIPRRGPRSRRGLERVSPTRCATHAPGGRRHHGAERAADPRSACAGGARRRASRCTPPSDLADAMRKAQRRARRPTAWCCCRRVRRVSAPIATTPSAAAISPRWRVSILTRSAAITGLGIA